MVLSLIWGYCEIWNVEILIPKLKQEFMKGLKNDLGTYGGVFVKYTYKELQYQRILMLLCYMTRNCFNWKLFEILDVGRDHVLTKCLSPIVFLCFGKDITCPSRIVKYAAYQESSDFFYKTVYVIGCSLYKSISYMCKSCSKLASSVFFHYFQIFL